MKYLPRPWTNTVPNLDYEWDMRMFETWLNSLRLSLALPEEAGA
jgi:hypothetical protein